MHAAEHNTTECRADDQLYTEIAQNASRFAEAVSQAKLYRLHSVKFKIIDGCNARCVMCNHWRRSGYRQSELSKERLLALSDELAALGARYVGWSGGEPTLRQDLPEIIARLSSYGIESNLTTNGTLLTEDYAARLLDARIRQVSISLESPVPEIHDRMVGIEGAWNRAVAGVRHLRLRSAEKPRIQVRTVLTRLNTGPSLLDMAPLLAGLGVMKLTFSPLYREHLTPEEQSALDPSPGQVRDFQEELLPRIREMGRQLRLKVGTDGSPANNGNLPVQPPCDHIAGQYQKTSGICYLPFYHCTIDYKGNVVACCHMRQGPGLIGDIREGTLARSLESARAIALRQRLAAGDLPDACAGCAMQVEENRLIDGILAAAPPCPGGEASALPAALSGNL